MAKVSNSAGKFLAIVMYVSMLLWCKCSVLLFMILYSTLCGVCVCACVRVCACVCELCVLLYSSG